MWKIDHWLSETLLYRIIWIPTLKSSSSMNNHQTAMGLGSFVELHLSLSYDVWLSKNKILDFSPWGPVDHRGILFQKVETDRTTFFSREKIFFQSQILTKILRRELEIFLQMCKFNNHLKKLLKRKIFEVLELDQTLLSFFSVFLKETFGKSDQGNFISLNLSWSSFLKTEYNLTLIKDL